VLKGYFLTFTSGYTEGESMSHSMRIYYRIHAESDPGIIRQLNIEPGILHLHDKVLTTFGSTINIVNSSPIPLEFRQKLLVEETDIPDISLSFEQVVQKVEVRKTRKTGNIYGRPKNRQISIYPIKYLHFKYILYIFDPYK